MYKKLPYLHPLSWLAFAMSFSYIDRYAPSFHDDYRLAAFELVEKEYNS